MNQAPIDTTATLSIPSNILHCNAYHYITNAPLSPTWVFKISPPETLFQICELFCEHCQGKWYKEGPPPEWWGFDNPRNPLLALSLVCKSIKPFAQRVLHHHFGYGQTYHKVIAQFCRTISNNPELAKDLRWADLSSFGRICAPTDVVKGWLPETITKLSRYLLHDQLAIAREDLLATIILLQAPNLERLDDVGKYDRAVFKFLRRDAVIYQ